MMTHRDLPDKDDPNDDPSKSSGNKKQKVSSKFNPNVASVVEMCKDLQRKPGVHSVNYMFGAGLKYTGDRDTATCKDCGVELSNWTIDQKPFTVHSQQKPHCSYVCSMKKLPPLTSSASNTTASSQKENSAKDQTIDKVEPKPLSDTFSKSNLLQTIETRSFSHWPHRTVPSSAQMIEAGFFNCNVGDRVICIYCNLICQQWTPHTDDPSEVHRTLSPNCPYVKEKLIRSPTSSIFSVNESAATTTSSNHSSTPDNDQQSRANEILLVAACNPSYAELPKRHASFATWPDENLSLVDDLVRVGFFYTGTKAIVTCFYCNGSLQNWRPNDNPMIEHARWFPHCGYAKQLCGDELYRKVQETKRAQQECIRANEAREQASSGNMGNNNATTNSRQLLIPDESTLSSLVAARLELPISLLLLNKNFKLSIIKRCWEDQLRLKREDFVAECDLLVACLILQKQVEHINGKKENIVVPSIKMRQIREENEHTSEQSSTAINAMQSVPNTTDTKAVPSAESLTNQTQFSIVNNQAKSNDSTPSNPCVLCLVEERRLSCIPCGHLATCVSCGHTLRSCPICRREIEAFVRIYI